MNPINSSNLISLIETIGLPNAIFATVVLSCHFFIFGLYNSRLKDRQNEIDRLAEENREYRDRFLKLLDKKFNETE